MSIKSTIIKQSVGVLMESVPGEVLIDIADGVLDRIEGAIQDSENKVDDAVVLPLINILRASYNIPDGDD